MAGAPVVSTSANGGDISNGQLPSSLTANSQRIAYVADRMVMVLDSAMHTSHSMDLFHLCLALARGIDYAVANNDVPTNAHQLPSLLKRVCQRKNDYVLQAAIMVLMISVKIASQFKWFTDTETKELLTFAKEIGSAFCSEENTDSEPSLALPTVLNVMARFCPQIKTKEILASLEVKSGFGAYLVDFHISKSQILPKDKIRLFITETDSVETSSCLISPPQANFLLNGKGVEKRTNAVMETRPQIPTDVTSLLKYGTNLLQVVGQINGNYLIVIASMSITPVPETPILPDYVPRAVAAQDSDDEIMEGRSRISLNCPISCKRIKTPAKGQACKHLKAFDLDTFLKLNMRTLSWRCPHCSQSTCYQDIRIDQYLVKVLKDVGENVVDVFIFEDGSWKASDQPIDKTHISQQNKVQGNTSCSDALPTVFDLTEEEDDETGLMDVCEIEDRKPCQTNMQKQSIDATLTQPASQTEDDFWSGVYMSTYDPSTSNPMLDVQNDGRVSVISLASHTVPPAFDAISPVINREYEELRGNGTLRVHNQLSAPIISNEYGRHHSMPSHITRAPIAVQALPAQSVQQQRSSGTEGQHQFARTFTNSIQNWGQRDHLSIASQLSPQNRPPGLYGQSSAFQTEHQRALLQYNQPPTGVNRTPPHLQRTPIPSGVSGFSTQRPIRQAPAHIQTARTTGTVQLVTAAEDLVDPSTNWRPMGRMRGSLMGQAYNDALSQFMSQPTQPSTPANPTSGAL